MNSHTPINLLKAGLGAVHEWNNFRSLERNREIDLSSIDLANVDLTGANLYWCNLSDANLRGVKLRSADLTSTKLGYCDLTGADLGKADLADAIIRRAILDDVDFNGAHFAGTLIAADLSKALGLDETVHSYASHLSFESILAFNDKLPIKFLEGCGLRNSDIQYFQSAIKGRQYASCFISYSTQDETFADKLYTDLKKLGVRCWKWDHDARTGQSLWGEIDSAVKDHDKVVLIASESALQSSPVNREISRAINEEDARKRKVLAGLYSGDVSVLFPVAIDDFIFNEWENELKDDVVKKVIANAKGWSDDEKIYERILQRLLKDLKKHP